MTEANESENSYLFETESASEAARLLERNAFLQRALGGAFPEQTIGDSVKRILDIGCGPGGWAIDVAKSHPNIEVIGIDISNTMLSHASQLALMDALQNVEFTNMNALRPLQFPDQHFDLVNMRTAVEYIPRKYWQPLLHECYRITRPGGIVRLMEADRMGHTNSHAFEQYHLFYSTLLHERGYGFSPDGHTFGITPMLGKLLQNAGYQHIQMRSYALNFSHATLFQTGYRHIVEMRFAKVRSQLLERKWATPEDLTRIYNNLLTDIVHNTFCGITYPLIFWGQK